MTLYHCRMNAVECSSSGGEASGMARGQGRVCTDQAIFGPDIAGLVWLPCAFTSILPLYKTCIWLLLSRDYVWQLLVARIEYGLELQPTPESTFFGNSTPSLTTVQKNLLTLQINQIMRLLHPQNLNPILKET